MENTNSTNEKLEKLDVSDAPPVFEGRPKPLFIRYPLNTNSENHKQNCLAYHTLTCLTGDQIDARLAGYGSEFDKRLRRCRAYLWIVENTRAEVSAGIRRLPKAERAPMSAAINEQTQQIKNHQDGMRYE